MIQEQGFITRIDGNYAWVRTERKSTCGQCAAQKGCGTNVFSKVLGNKLVEFKAINEAGADVGDQVILGLHESVLLKSALLMYLLPLATMFLFALLAQFSDALTGKELSEIWISLIALAGLVCGFIYVRQFATHHQSDTRYQPVVLRRASLGEQFTLKHPQEV